jgi:hypothetical protein
LELTLGHESYLAEKGGRVTWPPFLREMRLNAPTFGRR